MQSETGEIVIGGFWETEDEQECWGQIEAFLRESIGTTAPVKQKWAADAGFSSELDPICEEVRPGVFAIGAYTGHGNIVGTMFGKRAAGWAAKELLIDKI